MTTNPPTPQPINPDPDPIQTWAWRHRYNPATMTTWAFCGRCGKNIPSNHTIEQAEGFCKQCGTRADFKSNGISIDIPTPGRHQCTMEVYEIDFYGHRVTE